MAPGSRFTLPAASGAATRRVLYYFAGSGLTVGGELVAGHAALEVRAGQALELVAGSTEVEILMLQGRPIGEPVVQHGPFVMNSEAEIRQAFEDYRRTQFGGWPWPEPGPVHGAEGKRFAKGV